MGNDGLTTGSLKSGFCNYRYQCKKLNKLLFHHYLPFFLSFNCMKKGLVHLVANPNICGRYNPT